MLIIKICIILYRFLYYSLNGISEISFLITLVTSASPDFSTEAIFQSDEIFRHKQYIAHKSKTPDLRGCDGKIRRILRKTLMHVRSAAAVIRRKPIQIGFFADVRKQSFLLVRGYLVYLLHILVREL